MHPEPPTSATPVAVARLRLACIAAAITVLVFSQSPGKIAPDTKLDLVVAPWRFLTASLRMWDARAGAGQMQDQAYGYLFPMGPFFLLGKLAALPPWVVQRSWESALLIAAFLGVVRLTRLLGVPGFWPRVGAGLAYAFAPRVLTEIGAISSELLPYAVLPWVLGPLVRGSTEGSPRRAAARSGVALLFAGGINASATLAILPVPALWLLTRSPGPRRRALMSWWAGAVLAACLWWVIPLAVLGRYSPHFLDWIESSAVTTSATNLADTLRGADHWQAYLGPSIWPGGWIIASAPAAILATTAVAALGVTGMVRRGARERGFLLACVLLGLALVTLGHAASVGPPFAGNLRALLDGPLSAFRNVHKFDAVLRLPIAVGVGFALSALYRRWPRRVSVRWGGTSTTMHGRSILAMCLIGLAAVAAAPALTDRLVPDARSVADPAWWKQAGSWLSAHEGRGRALVVPGAAQPTYVWGTPHDDALQPYATSAWTVRNALPLTQPGYIRFLDLVETKLAAGADDPTLAPLLARAGIRYLVIRSDLDTAVSDATPLRFVRATVAASAGFRHVAGFGAGPVRNDRNRLTDLGLTTPHAAVDIYTNAAWADEVGLLPASGAVVANGSSDNLDALVAAGLPAQTPVIFGRPPAALGRAGLALRRVTTDGVRRREFGFGGINKYSATMSGGQAFSAPRAAHDYLPADPGRLTTAAYAGIADVQASTSASDPTLYAYRGPAYSPWAALDGDARTAWFSSSLGGAVGQWFVVRMATRREVPTLRLAFAGGQPGYPSRLRITTDAGQLVTDVVPSPASQAVPVPPGRTRSIRITVVAMSEGAGAAPVGIATLRIPGVRPVRTMQVASTGAADLYVFRAAAGNRSPCLAVGSAPACDPAWAVTGEEQDVLARSFSTSSAASYNAAATVRLRPGRRLDALLDAGNPLRALASSVESSDPRGRSGAAVDGDPATGWIAAPGDRSPTISIDLGPARRVDGLVITPYRGAPASRPTKVLVHAGGQEFAVALPADGVVRFPAAVTTSTVVVTVLTSTLRVSTDSLTGEVQILPVGIGEIALTGRDVPVGHAPAVVSIDCAAGLSATIDGATVPLQVAARPADVLAGREVAATPCLDGPIALDRGSHALTLPADATATPASVTLARDGTGSLAATAPLPGTSTVRSWTSTRRSVRVATDGAAFLVVRENANAGWRASLRGRTLPAVTLDGWQQGWLLPAGARGLVQLTYTPQAAVDWGLLAGLLAVLLLIAAALWPARVAAAAPVTARAWARRPVLALGALGLAVLGGPAGLGVGVLAVVLAAVARRRGHPLAPWVPPAVLGVGAVVEAWRPAGSAHPAANSAGVQLLCLFAIALWVLALFPAATPGTGEAAQQGPFEQVPGRRGRRRRRQDGEQVELGEVTAEGGPAHPSLYR